MEHSILFDAAQTAGRQAGANKVPRAMVVRDGAYVYEPILDGVCGFAWVVVKPGNSAFAKWLVKSGHASKHYAGGVCVWIRDYNQSMEKKEAHAHAMAKVFSDAGIKAYSYSRMD